MQYIRINYKDMKKEAILASIESLLPDDQEGINSELFNHTDMVDAEASNIVRKATAKELARVRAQEKEHLKREQSRKERGFSNYVSEQEKRVKAIEAMQKELDERDTSNLIPALEAATAAKAAQASAASPGPAVSSIPAASIGPTTICATPIQTTTRHDINKLLMSIGINLNMQLTKSDTRNIVASLLTCNEAQLMALMRDVKVPIVIKTIIKRLLEDMKVGRMDTVESLWERIFGSKTLADEPAQAPVLPISMSGNGKALTAEQALSVAKSGEVPPTPISREAYIILRDTLIK